MSFESEVIRLLKDELTAISEALGGFQILTVTDAAAVSLTVPTGASMAVISTEGDSTASDTSRVVMFKENGTSPTATEGIGQGNNDVYISRGFTNLSNFKAIGIEAGKTHKLKVQYYA